MSSGLVAPIYIFFKYKEKVATYTRVYMVFSRLISVGFE